MIIKGFKTVQSKDFNPQNLQTSVSEVINSLSSNPLLIGIHLKDYRDRNKRTIPIVLGPTPIQIPHMLGQVPTGYLITSQDTNAVIWKYKPNTAEEIEQDKRDAPLYLTLQASAPVTVTLWVF